MFSNKRDINLAEVKSCLYTAIKMTMGYFGLTVTIMYDQIMALNWKYFVSIGVFFVLVFCIKFVEKWFRDGGKLNEGMAQDLLDQKIHAQPIEEEKK